MNAEVKEVKSTLELLHIHTKKLTRAILGSLYPWKTENFQQFSAFYLFLLVREATIYFLKIQPI